MVDSFLLNIHRTEGHTIVSVCDEQLLGKTFEEDEKVLDIRPPFYGGKTSLIEEIIHAIRHAKTVNIVGNAIVARLVQAKIINKSGVHEIQQIKYAHIYKI